MGNIENYKILAKNLAISILLTFILKFPILVLEVSDTLLTSRLHITYSDVPSSFTEELK